MGFINHRYSTIKKIPGGNMTSVYLCEDEKKGLDEDGRCIVKLYDKVDKNDNELNLKIFYREVESLEHLEHPSIIKILDKGIDDINNSYFIVLEYYQSHNLDDFLKQNTINEKNKLKLIYQILNAVSYSHNKNIIHRDLKPSNILVNDDLDIKVIDFGVSKLRDTFYGEYTINNYISPKYASPEQKRGINITNKSDIYSLGIILFEILSGRIIDSNDYIHDIVNEVLEEKYKNIINKMIEIDLNKRYGNVRDIINDLKQCDNSKENIYYYLGVADSVVNRLYSLNYIQGQNRFEAVSAIQNDLSEETFLKLDSKNQDESQIKFNLFGKQFELTCVIDKNTQKSFTAIRVRINNYGTHQTNKEYCMPVNARWEVKSAIASASVDSDANDLIEELYNFNAIYKKEKEGEISKKNLIDNWNKVLRLQKENIEKSKYTIPYTGFEVDATESQIKVNLKGSIEEVPYIEDQVLTMTLKDNMLKNYAVGYFVDFKDDEITINLLKDANPELIADSGEIAVDRRMLEAALKRQEKALKMVQYDEGINTNLGKILLEPSTAKNFSGMLLSDISFISDKIDSSKKDNILKALQCQDIFLLQGPPGTGKTTFITELVNQILKANEYSRILISSQSNVAVDHALTKIRETSPEVSMIRIGRKDKLSEKVQNLTIDEYMDFWKKKVINACRTYLAEFKSVVKLDETIVDKYNLILEIEKLQTEVEKINKEIIDKNFELNKIKEVYSNLNAVIVKINSFSDTVRKRNDLVIDKELRGILSNFTQEYFDLGTEFINKLDEANEISFKKSELDDEVKSLKSKKDKFNDDISIGRELLNIKDDSDYYIQRKEIELKMEKNKDLYKKLSKVESVSKEWFDRVGKGEEFISEAVRNVTITGATCLGVANIASSDTIVFDWVIIDEAGRATPPEILVPMILGKRVVLVGDHKQLPPIVDKSLNLEQLKEMNIRKEDLEESLFEYIGKKLPDSCKGMLNEQYRMSPAIGNLISKVFYDQKLKSMLSFEDKDHKLSKWSGKGVLWLSTAKRPNKKQQSVKKSDHTTFRNKCEVDIIFNTLKDIDSECTDKGMKKEIAIIAGYEAQKSFIRKTYESEYKEEFKSISVEINTVDAFQGRETDIVFYSIVRSNDEGDIGFLKDIRRLNVALSRARELLFLVGDHLSVTRKRVIYGEQVNPFVEVLEHITRNSSSCELREV